MHPLVSAFANTHLWRVPTLATSPFVQVPLLASHHLPALYKYVILDTGVSPPSVVLWEAGHNRLLDEVGMVQETTSHWHTPPTGTTAPAVRCMHWPSCPLHALA